MSYIHKLYCYNIDADRYSNEGTLLMPLQATAVTYALPVIKSDSYRDVPKYRLLNSDGLSGNNDLRILALMRVHEYSVQYVYVCTCVPCVFQQQ